MIQPYQRKLRKQQQQAYDGAWCFYMIFLPSSMLYLIGLSLQQQIQIWIEITIMIISYLLARKKYTQCNTIGNQPYEIRCKIEHQQKNDIHIWTENQNSEMLKLKCSDKPQKHYCKICKIECPYRTRHCRKCNTCILKYDHHCFWIGNCVGLNNHYHFYLFLVFQSINNLLSMFVTLQLKSTLIGIFWWINLILLVLAFGFLGFTGYLFIYHTMLICSNMTTWQHMRRQRISYLKHLKIGVNPFSQGIIKNMKYFFFQVWCNDKNGKQWNIPTFQQAKTLSSGCNIIENQYYSCC